MEGGGQFQNPGGHTPSAPIKAPAAPSGSPFPREEGGGPSAEAPLVCPPPQDLQQRLSTPSSLVCFCFAGEVIRLITYFDGGWGLSSGPRAR